MLEIPTENFKVEDEIDLTKSDVYAVSEAFMNVQKFGISLFWKEKFVLLIRVYQLYALFFLFYFEFFPSNARKFFTPVMMTFLGSWHLLTENMYYNFIQKWGVMYTVITTFTIVSIVFYSLGLICNRPGKKRNRLERLEK